MTRGAHHPSSTRRGRDPSRRCPSKSRIRPPSTSRRGNSFVLPFTKEDAERLFPDAPVGGAIRELLNLGLLRAHDGERFEIHETVRAGLERLIPAEVRRASHRALAEHYRAEGNTPATVHHLDVAGASAEAQALARSAFMEGRHRIALLHFVSRHDLVSVNEIRSWVQDSSARSSVYFLPDLLKELPSARGQAGRFITLIEQERERFRNDAQWAWLVVECALACDPTSIADLVALTREPPGPNQEDDLDHVIHGARRRRCTIDARLLATFDGASVEERQRIARVLALEPSTATLPRVLRCWHEAEAPTPWRSGSWSPLSEGVILRTRTDAKVFLSCLPAAEVSEMIIYRSPSFGRLADLLWALRGALQAPSRDLLQDTTADDPVLISSLRVLLFIGDEKLRELARALEERKSLVGTFARLIPALLADGGDDAPRLRAQALDTALPMELRFAAFSTAALVGVDLSALYDELASVDPQHERLWRFALVTKCVSHPTKRAIPLLEEELAETTDKELTILAPLIMKLGELPGSEVSAFLVRMLSHESANARAFAMVALQNRRAHTALDGLLARAAVEPDHRLANMALVAAIASRPSTGQAFASLWPRLPKSAVWRCILAGRLRDEKEADHLVEIATDSGGHWQHRRAAILAAGRLPFEASLARIGPSVLAESSSFTADQSSSLSMHHTVAALLLDFARQMHQRFVAGRARFVSLFGEVFEDARKEFWAPERSPSGSATAEWLFDRLAHHGWPSDPKAADRVLGELHVPMLHAAVLRGYRLSNRADLIEQLIPEAQCEWLLVRSLCELGKSRILERTELATLRERVQSTPFADSPFVKNCLNDLSERRARAPSTSPLASGDVSPTAATRLTVEAARKAIDTGDLSGDPPYVFVDLTEDSFNELAKELAPSRDYSTRWVSANAQLAFTAKRFAVHGVRVQGVERHATARSALRPALAAANRFRTRLSWHEELLATESYAAKDYAERFLASLGALDDAARVADEFEMNGGLLLPLCADSHQLRVIERLITARLLPFLRRFARAGTDAVLEALTWIAGKIHDPAVDPVLRELFDRWRGRFRPHVQKVQHDENHLLWRAFSTLTRHPRFSNAVPDHDLRLMELLQQSNLTWFHKRDVVEALARSRRTYAFHESMLLRAAPYEHYHRDEVDRLDDAADALFSQAADEAESSA